MTISEQPPIWLRVLSGIGYALFVSVGLALAAQGKLADGAATLWIACVFDPFLAARRWSERAWWMKAWLYVHVAVALAVTALALMLKP